MTVVAERHIPIAKVVINEAEIEAVVAVLRSGNLRQGPQCAAFEAEFARSVGASHALAVTSGTAALQMAYLALLAPGDEVLLPSFTFFATASMVVAAGGVPIFCDIDPATLTIDLEDAARRITPRTRAIAPVHLFGNPVDVTAVEQLARAHDLAVIWDAAQAQGTRYRGRDVGSYADAVCYSLYPTKTMTTGEGGVVCTEDPDLAERLARLRSHGETEKYVHEGIGYNFRMNDMQAALGREQLRNVPKWVEQRRENGAYLRERLAESDLIRVQAEQEGGTHSYHQFSIVVDDRIERDALIGRLQGAGVGSAVHYPIGLHQQPAFRDAARGVSLPVTEHVSQHILSLPVHPYVTSDDLAYVADQVLEATETLRN